MNIADTTHQSTLRRASRLPGILLGLAVVLQPAQAATIAPEAWYSSQSAGTAVEGGGTQFVTNASGFPTVITYFTSTSLSNIGDSISVSLKFSADVGANSTESELPLHFGFYNSGGNQIAANNLGQNGGSPSVYSAYRGYRVRMNTAGRSQQNALRFETRSTNNNALASPSAYTSTTGQISGNNGQTVIDDTLYSVTYSLTRMPGDTLSVSFSVTGGTFDYHGAWSVVATGDGFTTDFDSFAITLSGSTTFDSITLHDVSITTPIPEPATSAALMGIGGLALVACQRRRR